MKYFKNIIFSISKNIKLFFVFIGEHIYDFDLGMFLKPVVKELLLKITYFQNKLFLSKFY